MDIEGYSIGGFSLFIAAVNTYTSGFDALSLCAIGVGVYFICTGFKAINVSGY